MDARRVTKNAPVWDVAAVHYVRTEGMVKDFDLPITLEFAEDNADSEYIVVYDGHLPVATCRLNIKDATHAKIERVCVVTGLRGTGVGRQLITEAEQWLFERGITEILISSRDEVVGFYEALGYKANYDEVEDNGVFVCINTYKTFTNDAGESRQPADLTGGKQFHSWFAKETNVKGAFERQGVRFTTPFGKDEGELPPEKGKYRLIVSLACPWAHRQLIARKLLGIEDVFSVGIVDPIRPEKSYSDWAFTLDPDGKDPVLGVSYLSDLYRNTDADYDDRFTVPAVIDIETGKVVNNDYFHLTYYWETVFSEFHRPGAPDLFPEHLRDDIEELNALIFKNVNNGVYRCGFATSQEAYSEAFEDLFATLDILEERLSGQRYLFGDKLTDSDIRLYVTLARFDAAYYNAFRTNRNRLADFPNLWGYARDLYQISAFGDTTDFDAIKKHYHLCCLPENKYQLVPKGPDPQQWKTPHGREVL